MNLLEIVPLGGAGEIGRNCTAVIQGDDIIVVDCGISFPSEEQPGVNVVIPDFSWLIENKSKIRAVLLTHAHEDHVGALPWLLSEIKVPVYATDLTHALIQSKLDERLGLRGLILRNVQLGTIESAGNMKFEFIHITHSVPDSSAVAIHTEHGAVLFTGDFKIDLTPVDGRMTNIQRLSEIGRDGVVALLSDCTNVDRPGWSPSESVVSEGFRKIFSEAEGRILITTFASNIHRMQQAINIAAETGRVVAVAGRRMEQTLDICHRMGALQLPKGIRVPLDEALAMEPHRVVVLTTGSQGEPKSALVQMSRQEYSRMRILPGDTIIYSARAIPGNEAAIWRTVNRIFRLGAKVVFDSVPQIHASGHAYREELKLMINILRPFYVAPVHGEPRHQDAYLNLARAMGYPEHRMFMLHDGQKLVMDDTRAWTEEYLEAEPLLIAPNNTDVVSGEMIRDRNQLAEHGVMTVVLVMDPQGGIEEVRLHHRGFCGDPKQIERAMSFVEDRLSGLKKSDLADDALLKSAASDSMRTILQRQFQARPMIICEVVRR